MACLLLHSSSKHTNAHIFDLIPRKPRSPPHLQPASWMSSIACLPHKQVKQANRSFKRSHPQLAPEFSNSTHWPKHLPVSFKYFLALMVSVKMQVLPLFVPHIDIYLFLPSSSVCLQALPLPVPQVDVCLFLLSGSVCLQAS